MDKLKIKLKDLDDFKVSNYTQGFEYYNSYFHYDFVSTENKDSHYTILVNTHLNLIYTVYGYIDLLPYREDKLRFIFRLYEASLVDIDNELKNMCVQHEIDILEKCKEEDVKDYDKLIDELKGLLV